MRRRLVLLALATTSMVALAFLVPLALLVRTLARDRALTAAERDASSLAPVVAISTDPSTVELSARATDAGRQNRLTVFLPDGRRVGAPAPSGPWVSLARRGRAFSTAAPGGMQVLVPVAAAQDTSAVVRVFVPTGLLYQGVTEAWVVLASLGVALVLVAVVVADRMARSTVGPVRALAGAAQRLGQGDLEARVTPAGPPEIAEVGRAFNRLATRVSELLAAEREMVADFSHRLRTPLTALRLDAEAVADGEDARRLSEDIEHLEATVDHIIRAARQPVRGGLGIATDLADVTRARVDFWAALAEEQARPWSVDGGTAPRPVPLDRPELEAALDALLGNVFTHTPDGTPFRVAVEEGSGGRALLVVEDEGPGISGDELVERGRSGAGSTGLGLDIARRTAEAVGGRLRVCSRPGGGARVELEFPTVAG